MLIFGYIISDVKYRDLNDDVLKVVSCLDECVLPVPKLVIGLDNAKEYAKVQGFEFDILNNTFPNGDMWTFKKTEKRDVYEDILKEYKDYVIGNLVKEYQYYYVNVYKLKINDIKRLINIILERDIYILIDGNMVYIPIDKNKIIGISFNHLNYINIEREKIIKKLKEVKNKKLIFSSNKKLWQLKNWFKGVEYVIPSILTNNAIN